MTSAPDFLARYDSMSCAAAHEVIGTYSTSFSLATKLLSKTVRTDVRNLYAMVRIADEIVDGTAIAAGISDVASLLDDYEAQILSAPQQRFHTDPVVHAYALTARRCEFSNGHIRAFFASMRRDLEHAKLSASELDTYIYGSAEVIGLLCLNIFLVGHDVAPRERREMEQGAQALGAAFQKINFLRDIHEDFEVLGREYFPGVSPEHFTDAQKAQLVAEIRAELATARAVMGMLPMEARVGVVAATDLFSQLTDQIDETPARELARRRISVPQYKKLAIAARALPTAKKMSR
ncbi:phytoene/squalene synthase family protein [Corynebacterium lubricantis]|uniref:phytoene/squalene synthase family protein n=1 Tax=Corynebacterium lubricantis TaxID=541095 RepID=UPI00037074D7|nr:phytoene/squalene synthase family protein [Corynebacterium lubricantis]